MTSNLLAFPCFSSGPKAAAAPGRAPPGFCFTRLSVSATLPHSPPEKAPGTEWPSTPSWGGSRTRAHAGLPAASVRADQLFPLRSSVAWRPSTRQVSSKRCRGAVQGHLHRSTRVATHSVATPVCATNWQRCPDGPLNLSNPPSPPSQDETRRRPPRRAAEH